MYRRLFCIPLLLTFFQAITQQPYLYFNKITTQNGLSHNKVNCILQDKRGFIWIGTDDGLNRYDGHYFTIFRHLPYNVTTISGNIITDILEDCDGILWIATADGGLTRYDYKLPPWLQFKQYKHLPNDPASIPINQINALLEDGKGYIWMATDGMAVLRFNKKTGEFIVPEVKGTKGALSLCIDDKQTLWVGRRGGGLLKVNINDLSSQTDARYLNLYSQLPHVTVSSLFRDKENNIWYGSWDKILYRFNGFTHTEETFQQKADDHYSFPADDILDFAEDNLGRLWMVGRYFGLTIYDKKQGKFFNYRYNALQDGTIADNQINCILIDRSGMVWLGTGKGISINNPTQLPFVQTFLSTDKKDVTVFDIYVDEQQNVFAGTSDGIFCRRSNSSQIEHIPFYFNNRPVEISKFFRDNAGNSYLGANFSLFKYSPIDRKISLLPNTNKDPVMYSIINSKVVSVISDTVNGHPVLMVSPYGHYLAYYDLIEERWISRTDTAKNIIERFNLQDNLIRKFYKSRDGTIWLAMAKYGLGEWHEGMNHFTKYRRNDPSADNSISNDNVFDIAEDSKNNLWISTYGGGLNYFDVKKNKFNHIEAANNLLEGLQIDNEGNIWMISNGNLHKYDLQLKTYTTFLLPDLEKSGGVKGNIFKDKAGNMFVAGNNFFISFRPKNLHSKPQELPVLFTDFKIFNMSYSNLLLNNDIKLDYNQNNFTVEFSAPNYSGSHVLYSYILQGSDKGWSDAAERNSINYSNLPEGDYVLRVRASISKGTLLGAATSLGIHIVPPFWKRWWFYFLCWLAGVSAIYGVYRYRINELLSRQAMRDKIAQDLHDNVGSTLSSISVYSQVAQIYQKENQQQDLRQALEKISETSGEMISEMNDIVWAINPRNDNMEKILQRMDSYARPLLQASNIHFTFTYTPSILEVNLEMNQRKNFYLIFKEAVNNALKYSECLNLTVGVEVSHRLISIKIKDDGKGFDINKMNALTAKSMSGNGLQNMKRRGKDLNGECTVTSEPGKGTLVTLQFAIPGFGDWKKI